MDKAGQTLNGLMSYDCSPTQAVLASQWTQQHPGPSDAGLRFEMTTLGHIHSLGQEPLDDRLVVISPIAACDSWASLRSQSPPL